MPYIKIKASELKDYVSYMHYTSLAETFKYSLTKKYADHSFETIYDPLAKKYIMFVDKKTAITIRHDNDEKEVIRRVDKLFDGKKRRRCIICMKNTKYTLGCAKCAVDTCYDCYLKLVEQGEGVFKCPQCRIDVSCRLEGETAEQGIARAREKIKLNKSKLICKRK